MTTIEMCNEINSLQSQIISLREKIDKAVYNYLNDKFGMASTNDDGVDSYGKVCSSEYCWSFNSSLNAINITYSVFRNKYGDLSDDKEIVVDCTTLDKFYH